MKLNLSRCTFKIAFEEFLGFMVFHLGIEPNLEKIRLLLDISPPRTRKKMQHFTRRVVALSRFMARTEKKCLSFFKILK